MSDRSPSDRKIVRLAKKMHERDCPNDKPYGSLSENHRYVHEGDAIRELHRAK